MASARMFLDKRVQKKDGTCPVRIIVSHNNSNFVITPNISVEAGQWDDGLSQVVRHPQRGMLNAYLSKLLYDIRAGMYELEVDGRLRGMTITELRLYVSDKMGMGGKPKKEEKPKDLFLTAMEQYMRGLKTEGTRRVYRYTLNKLAEYTDLSTLRFPDMTKSWLREFDAWMAATCRTNTRSIHMRNIRAVFNDAIDNEVIDCYPFRRFRIKSEPTMKRSLSLHDLRALWNYPCEEHQKQYRDMFMLSFCLLGINMVDLLNLTKDNMRGDRISYRRSKTGRLYDVKLEPEAAELIRRYSGKRHLLYVMDEYKNYKDYVHRMNKNLQEIGQVERRGRGGKKFREVRFPNLTSYWARHTWATIASELDVPKDVIGHALGHSWATSTTTDIYINFNMKKVDEANRRVLDYVFHDKQ